MQQSKLLSAELGQLLAKYAKLEDQGKGAGKLQDT